MGRFAAVILIEEVAGVGASGAMVGDVGSANMMALIAVLT
jgi:hypothetical protein